MPIFAMIDGPSTPAVVGDGVGTIISDMSGGGGTSQLFNGTTSQGAGSGALKAASTSAYGGKTYSPAKYIQQGQIWSANDVGWHGSAGVTITINLRGKIGSAPSSPSDGDLLGTTGSFSNVAAADNRTITSTNQGTAYDHVFFEIVVGSSGSICCAEMRFTELV